MAKVIITRGRPYELMVDLKQPGSPTTAQLPADATAIFYMMQKGIGCKSNILNKAMERVPLTEPVGGYLDTMFKLVLDATETADLPCDVGYAEDGENFKDTCRGHIAIDSPSSPDITYADALIPSIYIADIGL